MSSTEAHTPENPPISSGDLGSRSRATSSNQISDPPQVDSTLEQIECELAQIDRIIHSWSDGRSLRFDPAHVKPVKKSVDENDIHQKTLQEHARSLLRMLLSVNLIAAMLVSVTAICEIGFGWIGNWPSIGVLAGTTITAALLNVFFVNKFVATLASRQKKA